MNVRIRTIDVDDADALRPIEAAYCQRFDLEPLVGAASLGFFARSGHAFVAEDAAGVRGAVLAQAVWNGVRPSVLMMRLFAADAQAQEALAAAVVKSAYDAAVYDLVAEVADADSELQALLRRDGWLPRASKRFERRLGSRR